MATTSTKAPAITVDEYERMIENGSIGEDDSVELIEGRLVSKMTKKPRHSTGSEKCRRGIERVLPAGWHIRMEKPVRIPARDSMPEPDLSVVRGEVDDYDESDPGPGEVALVVEISDSTLLADGALAHTYCHGGIPRYWLLNLVDRQLEVYVIPPGGTEPACTILKKDNLVDLILDGQMVAQILVADLFPRR